MRSHWPARILTRLGITIVKISASIAPKLAYTLNLILDAAPTRDPSSRGRLLTFHAHRDDDDDDDDVIRKLKALHVQQWYWST